MSGPVQVVIADDSLSVRRLLNSYLSRDEGFEVVASVDSGEEAVAAVERHRPDVVTLDIDMPGTDGLTALRRIMSTRPTPTVMISGVGGRAAERTFRALDEGAVDFVLKYDPDGIADPQAQRREILAKVRAAATIRTVRTLGRGRSRDVEISQPNAGTPEQQVETTQSTEGPDTPVLAQRSNGTFVRTLGQSESRRPRVVPRTGVVVVGSSTGGPMALRQLLAPLPSDFPLPIVVVQHIPASFVRVLAAQLNRHTALVVRPAADGEPLRPGTVLLAPGDVHLLVCSDGTVRHQDGPPIQGHRPAIDITMQSAARVYGARTRGVLLTGMGSDGADGLVSIRLAGGRTLAQDEESSVVWGMPRRALEQDGVDTLAPPAEIAQALRLDGARQVTPPNTGIDPHPAPANPDASGRHATQYTLPSRISP